jgi:hypothetical protein
LRLSAFGAYLGGTNLTTMDTMVFSQWTQWPLLRFSF